MTENPDQARMAAATKDLAQQVIELSRERDELADENQIQAIRIVELENIVAAYEQYDQ